MDSQNGLLFLFKIDVFIFTSAVFYSALPFNLSFSVIIPFDVQIVLKVTPNFARRKMFAGVPVRQVLLVAISPPVPCQTDVGEVRQTRAM